MSHNVLLAGVKFTSLSILRAAITELQNEGANIELLEGQAMTARISGMGASNVTCDVMISCKDYKWDIALHRQEDGSYTPETESMFRHPKLSADWSAPCVEGGQRTAQDGTLGRLVQRYALLSTEIAAAKSGYATTRTYDAAKQQYQLEVNV